MKAWLQILALLLVMSIVLAFLFALAIGLAHASPYDDLFAPERGEYVLVLQYHAPGEPPAVMWRFGMTREECVAALEEWKNDDHQDMTDKGSDRARGSCVHESRVFKRPGVEL